VRICGSKQTYQGKLLKYLRYQKNSFKFHIRFTLISHKPANNSAMEKATKRILLNISLLFTLAIVAGLLWAFSKEDCYQFKSPDGIHDCVVTRYRYESLIPRTPGQGSDYSCFLSIYEGDIHCGTVPVPISWMISDLSWDTSGASIPCLGEWDFLSKTCSYWSEDGNTEISGL